MNVTVIILGIVVVFLLYILYQYFTSKSNKLATQTSLLGMNKAITVGTNASGTRYALGIWIYVNSWSMNSNIKTIYTLPGKISLFLEPTSPTLNVSIGVQGQANTVIAITNNFPIQKWTYVTVSVDNTFIDCYIDGKLIKSALINGTQNPPSESPPYIYLGGNDTPYRGNDITIADFYRWTSPLVPSDVWTKYMKGNGQNGLTSMFNNYGLDVTLLKNQVVSTSYSIF
jgi:hypothetical protein